MFTGDACPRPPLGEPEGQVGRGGEGGGEGGDGGGASRASEGSGRARHGRYAHIKPFYPWRVDFSL
eukprot:1187827-Prorocentrum_minimum.AAC.5